MLAKVNLEEAVGMVLAHDITKVIPGVFKGPAFRRGHVIRDGDVPELLKLGKEHVYVMRLEDDEIHEDDAARRIGGAIGGGGAGVDRSQRGQSQSESGIPGVTKSGC
jgi:hypothetical protein